MGKQEPWQDAQFKGGEYGQSSPSDPVTRFGSDGFFDHNVGLDHPSRFSQQDADGQRETFGGTKQQALYGYTTPAGPKYASQDPTEEKVKEKEDTTDANLKTNVMVKKAEGKKQAKK